MVITMYMVKKFRYPADSILSEIYKHKPLKEVLREVAETLNKKYVKEYGFNELNTDSIEFSSTCLERLNEAIGDSMSYDEVFHFAVICRIQTNPFQKNYKLCESCLFESGKTGNLEASLSLLTLAAYYASRQRDASSQSDLFREKEKYDAVCMLLRPEAPTRGTQNYKDCIEPIFNYFKQFFNEIPYLSEDVRKEYSTKAYNEFGRILNGGALHALDMSYAMIPLEDFIVQMNRDPTASRGTDAIFTFGILLG